LPPVSLLHSSWPFAASAAAIGLCIADVAYRVAGRDEAYAQFTVGAITWRAATKVPDYALLIGLVGGAAVAWLALVWQARRLDRRFGPEGANAFRATVGYCALPFVAWVGANLIGPAAPLDFVRLTFIAVALALTAAALLMRQRGVSLDAIAAWPRVVLTSALLGAVSLPALMVGGNRLRFVAEQSPVWSGSPSAFWLALTGGALASLAALWFARRSQYTYARHLLGALQLPLPWAFLIVLPMPWMDGNQIVRAFPLHWLPLVAFVLVAIAYADLLRRWLGGHDEASAGSWTQVLSPVCLAGVILMFRLPGTPAAYVPPDDYHFGEWVLPWWSWTSEGLLPFRDFVPARGLVNYTNGALAAWLGDASASFVQVCTPLVMAAWFLTAVWTTAGIVGPLAAAAMFALMPIEGRLTDIDLAIFALLVTGWRTFESRSGLRWAIGWLIAAIAAFLFAPGQGLLVIIATMPLLMWQLGRGVLEDPRAVRRRAVVALALLVVAAWLTPLGPMLLGAWRYVSEHAAVASVAHGVEWRLSFGTQGAANYWLAEAIRTSFIIVPIVCIAVLGGRIANRDWAGAGRLAVVAVPVLLLGLLYIPRAAGRIDPGAPSRLAIASIWMWAALMPIVLHAAWGSRRWPAILAITVFVMGALSSMYGGVDVRVLTHRAIPSAPAPGTLINGEAFGLPSLGLADVEPAHLTRLLRVRRTLDTLLDPGETYLDLTNRSAHYFYFARRPPIESGATYNLPNEAQQVRAIRRLEAARVPVVLARADSMLHDGGPPSLRDHPFYRYAVQRYAPVRIDGYVFLVRDDRLARLAALHDSTVHHDDTAVLLDEAFAPPSLEQIPAAWAGSWERLQNAAVHVRTVAPDASGEWSLETPLAGREAGLLVLELVCEPDAARSSEMTVSWAGDIPGGVVRFRGGSRLVVPLDAAPRWLLSQRITGLQLRSSNDAGCGAGAVRRVELWQRRLAAITDPT
jgi:hypothetical protein